MLGAEDMNPGGGPRLMALRRPGSGTPNRRPRRRSNRFYDWNFREPPSLAPVLQSSSTRMSRVPSITIKDIAREAGVSASTVSRVLNGTTPVASEKRVAVAQVVERLQYRPNAVAQVLARGNSRAIGVLRDDMGSVFWGQILRGVEEGLRGSCHHPVFAGMWHDSDARHAAERLLAQRVDGLIVVSAGRKPSDQVLNMLAQQLPLVGIGFTAPKMEERCIGVENLEGAYFATKHLVDLGHTRIAHITGTPRHAHATERLQGYLRALREAGLPHTNDLVVDGDFLEPAGISAVQTLLARGVRFTAIFAANDQMAAGARLALFQRGIRVPEDVSLVGFDDQPWAAYTSPPLTTVRQPMAEMGAAAVAALLRMLRGEKVQLPRFPTELIVRSSTAPPEAASVRIGDRRAVSLAAG
jgi:LacI family transcriptional regulator